MTLDRRNHARHNILATEQAPGFRPEARPRAVSGTGLAASTSVGELSLRAHHGIALIGSRDDPRVRPAG